MARKIDGRVQDDVNGGTSACLETEVRKSDEPAFLNHDHSGLHE
jgi:hypothetical protein